MQQSAGFRLAAVNSGGGGVRDRGAAAAAGNPAVPRSGYGTQGKSETELGFMEAENSTRRQRFTYGFCITLEQEVVTSEEEEEEEEEGQVPWLRARGPQTMLDTA